MHGSEAARLAPIGRLFAPDHEVRRRVKRGTARGVEHDGPG